MKLTNGAAAAHHRKVAAKYAVYLATRRATQEQRTEWQRKMKVATHHADALDQFDATKAMHGNAAMYGDAVKAGA